MYSNTFVPASSGAMPYNQPQGTFMPSNYARPLPQGQVGKQNDDRLVGGFLGPFVLGGITGGLLAPAFYPRPYYPPYQPYPPYYGPYYR